MPEPSLRPRGMILTLTERCNLRCSYCYVPVERGTSMTPEIADRAVDWFVEHAAPQVPLNLSFFGGEPFLARSEMRRTVERLRGAVGAGRQVRVVVPTNGLVLSADDLAWCRRESIELAVSIDGGPTTTERCHADGRPCATEIADAVPRLLAEVAPGTTLARMTVTPANVEHLGANVRTLASLGFGRIVYLPDHAAAWDEPALALWRREHERLATWRVGAKSAGRKVPDLPAWRAIEARLSRGIRRPRCGAGVDQVTVAPDGGIYPCYRFAYAPGVHAFRLGDVRAGITALERVAELAALDPGRLQPERRDCATCAAKDGCTHFCPALGFLALGRAAAVPEVACRLMEAQVAAVRRLRRSARTTTTPAWAAAAVMAAALTGASGCVHDATPKKNDAGAPDGETIIIKLDAAPDRAPDAVDANAREAGTLDVEPPEVQEPWGGGVCPVALPDTPPPTGGTCY
jgi:uncharacterized protein